MPRPDDADAADATVPDGLERFAADLRRELVAAAERDLEGGPCERTHRRTRPGR